MMIVLQKYETKSGNKIQIKYWLEEDEPGGELSRKMQEVSLNYRPDDNEQHMRLPMVQVSTKQLEGLLKLAGISF